MSDFLDTLVARSLSAPLTLPVVQPRLLARFESEAVDARATVAEHEGEAPPRLERNSAQARTEQALPQAVALPRPEHRESEPSMERRTARPIEPVPTPLRATAHAQAAAHDALPARTVLSTSPPTPAPSIARAAPSATASAPRAAAPSAPSATTPARHAHETQATRPLVVEREQATPSAIPRTPTNSARLAPVVTLAPPAALPAPRPATRATSFAQAAAPEPAPVIQVTIGRIEVRARETRGAPARPRATAGPLTSLEDYLARRQREGGGAP